MTNVVITVVMTLVLIQAFGLLLGGPLGINIALGPVFILIPIGMSAVVSIALAKKMLQNQPLTKKDVFAVFLVAGIALLVMFFLKDFVPEIFSESVLKLQSIIGV